MSADVIPFRSRIEIANAEAAAELAAFSPALRNFAKTFVKLMRPSR
jgi:hypothetical protein